MQRTKISRRWCNVCQAKTKHEQHVTAMGCGDLLMVVVTLGLWVPVRWIFTPGAKCCQCGK